MTKQRIIFILGIWVGLLPFLGFPSSWKSIFFAISGLILVYISYILHRESKDNIPKEKRTSVYVESNLKEINDEINNNVETISEPSDKINNYGDQN